MRECKIHFLNVLNGDCTIIQHETGRISVIDICNGNAQNTNNLSMEANFHNQDNPTNPISYLKEKVKSDEIFRFILTHPDMDHMDGIKKLFYNFTIYNFWDTNHEKDLSGADFQRYSKDDWECYKQIRRKQEKPKVLQVYQGYQQDFYRLGYDNFEIISPSKKLVNELKEQNNPDWNEISYVLLHSVFNRKILYCGDSGNKAWKNIMGDKHLLNKIKDIDILLAPHHGRKTGGDDLNKYLNQLNPKLAIFGNTDNSEHKNYSAFYNREIPILTNNEAGDIIATIKESGEIYLIMTRNEWDDLLEKNKKNENWENKLNKNNIYLNRGIYE